MEVIFIVFLAFKTYVEIVELEGPERTSSSQGLLQSFSNVQHNI